MIKRLVGTCEFCKHYEPGYDTRLDGRELGTCKESPGCICCSDKKQIFGANGGGTFLCTKDFGCRLWESNKPKINLNANI